MEILQFALVHVLMLISAVYGCEDSETWTHKTFVDEDNYRVFMQWKPDKENITIKITGETKGWLEIGFSSNGAMAESDIALGWVKDGKGFLQDRHGTSDQNGQPAIDKHQDLELLTSSENQTHTTLCFRRKLNTCDQEDIPITNETMTIIWAMNSEDPSDPDNPYSGKTQQNRGEKKQYMLSDVYPKPTTNDIKTWKVQVPNITVPKNKSTLFYCQFIKPPKVTKKQHVIGYVPVLQKENEMNIHHFAINECTGDDVVEEINKIDFNKWFECYSDEAPKVSNNCHKHLIMWISGDVGDFYPPHVGLPLAFYNEKPVLYLVNIHYNNADMNKDIHDSSFLEVYYTEKLRKNDAAIMTFSYTISQNYQLIPPKQENWTNVAHCTPDCLQKTIPKEKINVFGSILHGHMTTRKIILRHFRNKIELPPIAESNNYDTHYQQAVLFKDVEIYKTDQLTVECTRNTMDHTKFIVGGAAENNEMCQAFLWYYPRNNLISCSSHLPLSNIGNVFGINEFYPQQSRNDELKIKEPSNLANKTFITYLDSLQLNKSQITTFEQMELTSDKTPECLTDNDMKMDLKPINYPENFSPYIKSDICENNNNQAR